MPLLLLGNLIATLVVLAFVVVQRAENDGLRDDVRTLEKRMRQMTAAFDNLKAAVAAQTAVDASAVTLIQGLADKLANLPAGTSDEDLKALAEEIRGAAQPLADAVAANTPASAPTGTTVAPAAGTPASPAPATEAPASPAAPGTPGAV